MKNIINIVFYVCLIVSLWGIGVLFARSVSDYEVITPEDGIKCVVVSRMFNTSVDCWKE